MSEHLAVWKCHECSMTFTSPGLLAKHKSRFCPGNTVGRTTARIPEYTPRPETPEHRNNLIDEKVGELQALKDRRSRMREIRDMEERMLLDNLDTTEQTLRGAAGRQNKGRLKLSKHQDLRQLQIDYERLQEHEQHFPTFNGRQSVYSRNTDSSMSIYLPDEGDIPRRDPHPQLAQLAANHGRQMEMLQGKNKDLERQRDEIRRRLEDLGRRPIREEDTSNSLLDELREQEARNQRLLDDLRRQLADARQPINIIAEERFEPKKPNLTYPIYYGSSLVAEISAIRQAYLQNGGSDPEVMAQLAQMLAEAQAIEDQLKNPPKEVKVKEKKSNDYMQTVMSLEMENERMQRELMLLQEQNMLARQRRKDDREGRIPHLWSRLRSFVHQPSVRFRYLSMLNKSGDSTDNALNTFRSMTAMSGYRTGLSGMSRLGTSRPQTALGLYNIGATFPYGSIYGYSSLSPLYYDSDYHDDDYYSYRRLSYFPRTFRSWRFFSKTETEEVEETPEKPKVFMPFSVYPRINKRKTESRMVESVVSGFRPGERLMKVYKSQEVDAGSGVVQPPQVRYSFRGTGGRVNTLYTYNTPRDGNTTSRSVTINGGPLLNGNTRVWNSQNPLLSDSQFISYWSPKDGLHKTVPYVSPYQNLLPLTTSRSSYPLSPSSSLASRTYTKVRPLPRAYSQIPTSLSPRTSLHRYPLSPDPLSRDPLLRSPLARSLPYRSMPIENRTLVYRGEDIPLEGGQNVLANPPLVYRGEQIPMGNPSLVYRGEPMLTDRSYTNAPLVYENQATGVTVIPVDRNQGTSEDNKENQPADSKGKKSKQKKEDKKSKSKTPVPQTQPESMDPFVTSPQLAARFQAAGVALQAISRLSNRQGGQPAQPIYQPPVILRPGAKTSSPAADPLSSDPGLAARLQAASMSLIQLREKHTKQQQDQAAQQAQNDQSESQDKDSKDQHDRMVKEMAEAQLESTQRTVRFLSDMNRQEQEYYDQRDKTRASERAVRYDAYYNTHSHRDDESFQPPPSTYKPPPEETQNAAISDKGKGKTDKKKDKKSKKK